jgi:hypothetical protein
MKHRVQPLAKICTVCGALLPVTDFYEYHKESGVYYMPYCKECNKARLVRWRRDNPERRRAAQRSLYARRHPIAKRPRIDDAISIRVLEE